MKRSNPSTVDGGGEMKRDTSSVVSSANSGAASEARISRSGQAAPAPGDLYVASAVLKPSERKKLVLVIDREVG